MKRFWGKLDFIHRRLWHRDGLYRFALLLGPATLLGGGLAFALWTGAQVVGQAADHPPPWAPPLRPANVTTSTGPLTVQPAYKLPAPDADKPAVGYETGWQVTLRPVEISPTLDVQVKPTPLLAFAIDTRTVDMVQLTARGPKGALYVGVGSGLLAIRAAGTYALTLGFQRPAGEAANCIIRLGLSTHRIFSNVDVNIVTDLTKMFDRGLFDLQPGLYSVVWMFGCWHDREMTQSGRISLLIGQGSEQKMAPVRPGDILRPASIKP
jgi:hypothetical protein